MAMTPQKRKKMEDLIYKTFNALDKTGSNTKHYKSVFSAMSDNQFDKFFKDFFADPSKYLILTVCDYQIDLKMDDIEDAAKVLGVPLFERVAFPHYTMDKKNIIVSKDAVSAGYCHF